MSKSAFHRMSPKRRAEQTAKKRQRRSPGMLHAYIVPSKTEKNQKKRKRKLVSLSPVSHHTGVSSRIARIIKRVAKNLSTDEKAQKVFIHEATSRYTRSSHRARGKFFGPFRELVYSKGHYSPSKVTYPNTTVNGPVTTQITTDATLPV